MIVPISKEQLEAELDEWKNKVLSSFGDGDANTYRMIVDVDKIIADAFNKSLVVQDDFEPSIRFFDD